MTERKKVLLRITQFRCRSGHLRDWIFQLGCIIGGTAVFTVVTVLISSSTIWANPFDKTIRQEHHTLGIIKLLDGALDDMSRIPKSGVDKLGKFLVLRRVRGVKIVG